MLPRVCVQSLRRFGVYEVYATRSRGSRFMFEDSTQNGKCWKCGASQSEKLFCEKCSSLQEPNKQATYFEVIGVQKSYDLQIEELTRRFKQMQKLLHPDRFSTKAKEELAVSENYSALVNQAYATLLNPLERGLYLLRLEGLSIEEGSVQTDPSFLMEIMERNEKLADAKDAETVIKIASENQEIISELSKKISNAFKKGDLKECQALLSQMKYFWSIEEKVKELKQQMGIVH